MKIAALIVLAGCACANAQVWNEVGDAGQTVATTQMTSGVGPLLTINGGLVNGFDFDLYCIHLDGGPIPFSARVTQFGGRTDGSGDSVMALFTSSGLGIAYGDDTGGFGLSFLTGNYPAGDYILGIWGFPNIAVPLSASGAMWQVSPFNIQRAPDGPGAAGTLIGFGNAVHGYPGAYAIQLTGASFCPTPGAAAVLGLGGLMASRRRRA